ncbi:MAG: hypothetical protein WEB52_02490 [Dehalococcoidia bacterium]
MDAAHVMSALGNIAASAGLAIAGLCALLIAFSGPRRHILPFRLAIASGAGLIALAADEGLELHDRAGRWLYQEHGVVAPGPINHVDDLFVIGYLAAGVAVLAVYARRLLRTPRFFGGLIAAGALLATGTGLDALGTTGSWTDAVEETLEAGGALLLAAVFAREALGLQQLDAARAFLSESTPRGTAKGGAGELESKAPQPDSRVHLRPM